MHKKFTLHTRNIVGLICLMVLGLISTNLNAQKWSGANGNEWLISGKKYAKIAIKAKGIHQVNLSSITDTEVLPAGFNPANLQLWHRGVQIPLLSASANAITFYGEPNDGKFDELLMRPYYNKPEITSRMNKFVSLFSDNGMYFLTVGASAGLRAAEINSDAIANPPVTAEGYHMKTDTVVFKNDFSHSNSIFVYPQFLNSFYEYGKTLTGNRVIGANISTNPFKLSAINSAASSIIPKVKFLLHNRGTTAINLKVQVAAKDGSARTVTTIPVDPFTPLEYEFPLQLDGSFIGDVNANGEGNIVFSMENPGTFDMFSVSYYTVTYPQNFDVQQKTFYTFNIPSGPSAGPSRINLSNIPGGTVNLLDVTNVESPKKITTATPASFVIPRTIGEGFSLLAATGINAVTSSQITYYKALSNTFSDYKDYNFYIITTDDPAMVSSAQAYATYRSGTKNFSTGQNYKPIVLKISEIYNQYNYGEPSAVGVRRCIDFLISDNNFNKYLLLIGSTATYVTGTRELTNEVPTVGYPGSDNLLVTGLGLGSHIDIPSIAIGRIPTSDFAKVDAYLQKVKEYEDFTNPVGRSWQKNIVHAVGGKSEFEVTSFNADLAGAPAANVTSSAFNGNISLFSKDPNNACPANHDGFTDCQMYADAGIATKLNSGAGVLTYYGHGNPRVTDYFYGYVTDPARGFASNKKYSALFIYGCDVNNVFRGFNENISYDLSNNSRRPFTVDWLLTPDKGAITVVGNTFEGYESILTPYLEKTYAKLFVSDGARRPLGSILKAVTTEIINSIGNPVVPNVPSYNYNYTEANALQTMLLGDPSVTILLQNNPLPVELVSFEAKYQNDNLVKIDWSTSSEKNNGSFVIERSYNAKNFETIGSVEGKGDSNEISSYVFYDNAPLPGVNYYRLVQIDKDENGNANLGKKTYSRIVSVEMPNNSNFVISPNPSSSNFNIELKGSMILKTWNLIDINGRTIKSSGIGNSVDMSNKVAGEYIIEIITNNNDVMRKKVVKQ